jgi:cell division protein FtsX
MWLWVVILVFVISIAVIIYSVIWNFIYYYRDEIYITKLVWGANTFIYWPFVLQWMMYSFIAFILNTVIFILLLKNLRVLFWDIYSFSLPIGVLFLEMFGFIVIWWISWFFSSRKYLRRKSE